MNKCLVFRTAMQNAQISKTLVFEMRKRLALTQQEFADRVGVTFVSVNRWENAKHNPSAIAMILLRGVLVEMGDRGEDLLKQYFTQDI
jgi:DNA-binding transcriptional regulator YiaG